MQPIYALKSHVRSLCQCWSSYSKENILWLYFYPGAFNSPSFQILCSGPCHGGSWSTQLLAPLCKAHMQRFGVTSLLKRGTQGKHPNSQLADRQMQNQHHQEVLPAHGLLLGRRWASEGNNQGCFWPTKPSGRQLGT